MWQLYVVVDRAAAGKRPVEEITAAAIRGGADVIQFRDKQGSDEAIARTVRSLLSITREAKVPLILNDRVEVACRVGVEGIHVGQEDWPVARIRRLAGKGMLIGKSTHSLAQAIAAEEEGANYIGFGPLFQTPTKPDYGSIGPGLIRPASQQVSIPMVCIGGIDTRTLSEVLQAGARCIAVVRAVCAAEDPESAARSLKFQMSQFHRETSGQRL